MTNNRFNNTEEKGIDAAKIVFAHDFGWIFREITKRDIGIDAVVEKKSGLIILLQIKTGSGNFKKVRPKDTGLTYYDKKNHYEYWLNLKAPVLFIAHLPEKNKTYWQYVAENNFKQQEKSYSLFIPFAQELTADSEDDIINAITPTPKIEAVFIPDINNTGGGRIQSNIIDFGHTIKLTGKRQEEIYKKLLADGFLKKSIHELKSLCCKEPNNHFARITMGREYLKLANVNEALSEFSLIWENTSTNPHEESSPAKLSEVDSMCRMWAHYMIQILQTGNSDSAEKCLKVKPCQHIQLQAVGELTEYIDIVPIIDLDGKDHPLQQYSYNSHILPLEWFDKGIQVEILTHCDEHGNSPKMEYFTMSKEMRLLDNSKLVEGYCFSLRE